MKSIIFAIVCLAAASAVSSADVCTVQCSGEWSGNSSLVIEVGNNVDIVVDVVYKIFAVVNVEQNLIIAVKGNFLLIVNIKTGGYLIIDLQTQYAVYGKIQIDITGSGGSFDYDKVVFQLNAVFVKYTSIISSTSGSFNFGVLITAFFHSQFDLSIILQGQAQLVAQLQTSFSIFFQLIRQAIVQGSITYSQGIWGILVVAIGVNIDISGAIVEVVQVCIQYFGEIQIEIFVEIVKRIRIGISEVRDIVAVFVAYISINVNARITEIIKYINDARNRPVQLKVTLAGSTYALVVVKISGQYVISFTSSSSGNVNLNVRIIFAGDVLIIYNLKTDIAIALYRRYLLVLNATAESALLATWQFLGGVKVAVVNPSQLSIHLKAQAYAKVAADVKAIINKATYISISWTALLRAVVSGSASAVGSLVGSAQASIIIKYYYSFCVSVNGSSSVGGIASGVFGSSGGVVTVFKSAIDIIGTATQNWGLVIKYLTGGSISVSSG